MDSTLWKEMFHLDVSVLEKILRPVIVYAFLIIGLRLAGKRTLAQLNPFDLIVLLMLSNTVQNAIIGNDNSVTGGVIGATTLLAVNYLVVWFFYRHRRLDRLTEGNADMLIERGQVNRKRLRKELITRAELDAAARRQGLASLEECDRALLEPGGTFSFYLKRPTPDAARHDELLARLDEISRELAALRAAQK